MTEIKLSKLIEELNAYGLVTAFEGGNVSVAGATCDSRNVAPHMLFICKGQAFQPSYLEQALACGASAYLCEEALANELKALFPEVPRIVSPHIREAMAYASQAAWGHPEQSLSIVGITGTKGKTTTATLVRELLEQIDGKSVAFMGTHIFFDGEKEEEPINTTPEPPDLYRILAHAKKAGCKHVVMEISSQALKYGRVQGLGLSVGCFLNISNDHISDVEHPTFDDYFSSKLQIFSQAHMAVYNKDAQHSELIQNTIAGAGIDFLSYSAHNNDADVRLISAKFIPERRGYDFVCCGLDETGETAQEFFLSLAGLYNVENALAALCCVRALGIEDSIITRAARITFAHAHVAGRMEFHTTRDKLITVIVDYAHNALSYEAFFDTIDELFQDAYKIAVFGVCGNRAYDRWIDLPTIASKRAQHLVLTSDEPANHDPDELVDTISAHVAASTPFEKIANRDKAVEHAFDLARSRANQGAATVLCLLGKGAESTMLIGNESVAIEPDTLHAARLVCEYDEETL